MQYFRHQHLAVYDKKTGKEISRPKAPTEKPPLEWAILNYRRMFRMSPQEFREIPIHDFFLDVEMLALEAKVEKEVLKLKKQ